MNNHTRKWIRAGLETIIHGGAAAVSSSVTAGLIDSKDWGFLSMNELKLVLGTFALNGGIRFFQWWQNNPLPEKGTDPPFPAPQPMISINPLSKVTPTTVFADNQETLKPTGEQCHY